ncbi:MAG TPA: endonuclease III [Clostridiales bacterium]|nr:endonuclease III [Clostridiales bacterium]
MGKKKVSKKEQERIKRILDLLDKHYSEHQTTYLNHDNPWQLLIATILSAQCTDDRVNQVTSKLFKKYQSIEDFANADIKELEQDVFSTGFYRNKAKNIIGATKMLLSDFNGEVPSDIESLTNLSGVGRKTANVIRGNIYNIPSIVVDTHVKRISNRLGLASSKDPEKVEFELMEILPEENWIEYNLQVIAHGRSICTARSPKCEECFFNSLCPYYSKKLL